MVQISVLSNRGATEIAGLNNDGRLTDRSLLGCCVHLINAGVFLKSTHHSACNAEIWGANVDRLRTKFRSKLRNQNTNVHQAVWIVVLLLKFLKLLRQSVKMKS